ATLLNTAISFGEGSVALYSGSLHNLGDVGVSFAPVAAGLLVGFTSRSIFDPLVGLAVAIGLVVSTVRELFLSIGDLLWPEQMSCGHETGAIAGRC
ncbi:MAG TPA: cation transporter, partial [Candidatus Binatia bacterium]|nr:cation transporter [Candidatus Binatia bacterium]